MSVIRKARALAVQVKNDAIDEAREQLTEADARIEQLTAREKNLLGIEKPMQKEIRKSLANLKEFRTQLQNIISVGTGFKRLGLDPLTWRGKDGWPQLAVFSLSSPRFEIAVTRSYDGWDYGEGGSSSKPRSKLSPKLPAEYYGDVLAKLKKKAVRPRSAARISATFSGYLPDGIRPKIAELKTMFQDIFVLVEPDGPFIVNKTAKCTPERGLLVAGYDGEYLWILDDEGAPQTTEMVIAPDAAAPAEQPKGKERQKKKPARI